MVIVATPSLVQGLNGLRDRALGPQFIGSGVYTRLMRWRLRGRFVILGVVSLMASPVGILAQCPRLDYVHFLFRPDHPARHAAVDDVIIEGAPDLEGLIRTKVDTWLERSPSEKSGETDVTIQAEPERLAAKKAEIEEELKGDAAEGDSRWISALEESVKEVLQDNGYFRAQVTVEKIVLSFAGYSRLRRKTVSIG